MSDTKPTSRAQTPSYRQKSAYAVVTLRDGAGGRRDVLLRKYSTEESW
jgi:hypothetical protein